MLDEQCGPKVDIAPGRKGGSPGFVWTVFSMLLGAVATGLYIHLHGVPPWLPIRNRGFGGLYQELSEHEGI